MKTKLLTDVELRARWSQKSEPVCFLEEGTILTPSAKDFIREHGITLCYGVQEQKSMTKTPIPTRQGKAVFIDAASGDELNDKPEEMTHLRGNLLVPKTHPRIAFRGRLDSLMAQIIEVQLTAWELNEERLTNDLGELNQFTGKILAAEVKDLPLDETLLLGMDSSQIRFMSHHVKESFGIDHPIPNFRMGRLCVMLNRLRTQVRETELSAAHAFPPGDGTSRPDIIKALNRLSSCVYIILCRKLSGYYDRRNGD